MGVMDRFERGVERVVSGAFAKAFKSEVKPVEIASAIQRDMDDRAAAFSQGRTVVPNVFEVELGESDYERVEEWGSDALAQEIISSAADYAREQGYSIVGPLSVEFAAEGELETGRFRVRSSTKRAAGSAAAGAAEAAGAGAPAQPHRPAPSRSPSSTSTAPATPSPARSRSSAAARRRTSWWTTRESRAVTSSCAAHRAASS